MSRPDAVASARNCAQWNFQAELPAAVRGGMAKAGLKMQANNKLLDDLARVAGGALGAISGLRGEVEAQLRQQFERILSQMDVVTRDVPEGATMVGIPARSTLIGAEHYNDFVPYGSPCSENFDPATQKLELLQCEVEQLRRRLAELVEDRGGNKRKERDRA